MIQTAGVNGSILSGVNNSDSLWQTSGTLDTRRAMFEHHRCSALCICQPEFTLNSLLTLVVFLSYSHWGQFFFFFFFLRDGWCSDNEFDISQTIPFWKVLPSLWDWVQPNGQLKVFNLLFKKVKKKKSGIFVGRCCTETHRHPRICTSGPGQAVSPRGSSADTVNCNEVRFGAVHTKGFFFFQTV